MKFTRNCPGVILFLVVLMFLTGCVYPTQTPTVDFTPSGITPVSTQPSPSPTQEPQPTFQTAETQIPIIPTETATELPDLLTNISPAEQNVLFWYYLPPQTDEDIALNQIVDEFNQTNSEGIFIDAYNLSTPDSVVDQTLPLLNSVDVPALITTNPEVVFQLSEGLTDLTPFIYSKSRGIFQDNPPSAWVEMLTQTQIPGLSQELLAFPLLRKVSGLYANTAWLTELGYPVEPNSSQELADMACRSSRQSFSSDLNQGLTTGLQIQPGLASFALLTFAFGGSLDSPDSTTFIVNSPQAIEAMTYLQKYALLDCFFPVEDQETMRQSLTNAVTSLLITDTDILPEIEQNDNEVSRFEWTFYGIPDLGDQSIMSIMPGLNFSIPNQSPEQMVAAWEFIKYFQSVEAQSLWSNASGNIPFFKYEASEIGIPEQYDQILSSMHTLRTVPSYAEMDQIDSVVAEAMLNIMNGSPVTETLEALQQIVDEISSAFFAPQTFP